MSLTKYEILLKTAECGSFTRAAQELNFTQSGISHAVSSLEAELGTTLVVRSHGGVSLTADGRALLPYFREMCALQHQLEPEGRRPCGDWTPVLCGWPPSPACRKSGCPIF